MAAGNGGAENMAATVFMRVIQDCICSAFLAVAEREGKGRERMNEVGWGE